MCWRWCAAHALPPSFLEQHYVTPLNASLPPLLSSRRGHPDEELRCVLAVMRHGDRTPKQKMKMKVTQEPLLALLHRYIDSKGKQAKLKVRLAGGCFLL